MNSAVHAKLWKNYNSKLLEHIQYKECGLAFGLQTHFEGHKSDFECGRENSTVKTRIQAQRENICAEEIQ